MCTSVMATLPYAGIDAIGDGTDDSGGPAAASWYVCTGLRGLDIQSQRLWAVAVRVVMAYGLPDSPPHTLNPSVPPP